MGFVLLRVVILLFIFWSTKYHITNWTPTCQPQIHKLNPYSVEEKESVDGEFQEFEFIDEEFEHGGVEDEDPSQGFVDWDSPPTYDDDVNEEDPIEEPSIFDQVEEINLSKSIAIFYEEDEPLEDVSLSESFTIFHEEEVLR
jgi:hypothetical protein